MNDSGWPTVEYHRCYACASDVPPPCRAKTDDRRFSCRRPSGHDGWHVDQIAWGDEPELQPTVTYPRVPGSVVVVEAEP